MLRELVPELLTLGEYAPEARTGPAIRIRCLLAVDVLDRVDQHQAWDPKERYRLDMDDSELSPEELAGRRSRDVRGEPSAAEGAAGRPRRLEG